MKNLLQHLPDRRKFLRTSAGLMTGLAFPGSACMSKTPDPPESIHIIGPVKGFTPQVGTLVSMLAWMQDSLHNVTQGLTQPELDYLHDKESNTIGALILHIASVEVFYQDTTFYGKKELSAESQKKWGVAMNLGDEARKEIRGQDLDYYLNRVKEVRDKTLRELKKRDDQWLATIDPSFFGGQPTNNYCKWFHVAEHIANHRGQITWIRKRLPRAKEGKDE